MNPADRLIVALDRSSREEIFRLAGSLHGVCGLIKIGLQAFISNGPSIVRDLVSEGHRIFLDLKLHDIPNTVAHAVAEAAGLGASLMTIHATGGRPMCVAAAESASRAKVRPRILGVTVLTSIGSADLRELGTEEPVEKHVLRLARLCQQSGLDGVVASPLEIAPIREACGPSLLIVTPGIRGPLDDSRDQRRTMSAPEAVGAGADYIVVGRPITEAPNPRDAAAAMIAAMANHLP